MADARDGIGRALRAVSRGAAIFFVGHLASNAFGFGFNFLLARELTPAVYGAFAYTWLLVTFAARIGTLGGDRALLRFLPEFEDDPRMADRALGLAVLGVGVVTPVLAAGLYLFAPTVVELTIGDPVMEEVLGTLVVAIPLLALVEVAESVFRAIDRPLAQVSIANALEPGGRFLAVGGGTLLGFGAGGFAGGIVAGLGAVCAISLAAVLVRTERRPTVSGTRTFARRYAHFALPLTFNRAGAFLTSRLDLLMVGLFLAGTPVARYNVSVLLASVVVLPLHGLNQIFPAYAVRFHTEGRRAELSRLFAVVTRWTFTLALPAAIVLAVYRTELLGIFGPSYREASLLLLVVVLSRVLNAVAGPAGLLLQMTDHQYLATLDNWLLGVVNGLLNVALILQYGAVGAAVASVVAIGGINALRIVQVRYTEGYLPYTSEFLKPLLAGAVCLLVTWGLSRVVTDLPGVVVAGAVGGGAYVAVLLALGIPDEDRELFDRIVA